MFATWMHVAPRHLSAAFMLCRCALILAPYPCKLSNTALPCCAAQ